MTEISADDELASLSEFTFLRENAKQADATGPLPTVERIDSGAVSALKFGDAPPRVVFLHGGGQNAHTWDTVIVGLGEPALTVDLPGHGRSAWREDGDYGPKLNATAVEPLVRELAPDADLVVGMSLGGLTALRLAVTAPELVRRLVLVDVTPSAPERHTEMTEEQKGTVALVQGERTFPSFDAMLEVTVAAAPHRDRESLRRGVFHNAKRLDDGTWTWRYDSIRAEGDRFSTACGRTSRTSPRRRRWCVAPTRTSSTTTTPPNSPASHPDSRACTSSRTPDTRCRAISRASSWISCEESSPDHERELVLENRRVVPA